MPSSYVWIKLNWIFELIDTYRSVDSSKVCEPDQTFSAGTYIASNKCLTWRVWPLKTKQVNNQINAGVLQDHCQDG